LKRYYCNICNAYEYYVEKGDTENNIPPSTHPEDFPDDWKCPICQADKSHMILGEKQEENSHNETISEVMIDTLTKWGVDSVFGMVGHSNLGLASAIMNHQEKGNLKFIGVRHEGAAAFAASAYGKLTDKPAVCFSIAGPGATNMLTGLWDAKMDRAPVIAMTGQVNAQVLGRGYFQEIDLKSAYQAVSSWSQVVLKDSKHSELASLAAKNALLNRDVSSLIFPDEIQVAESTSQGHGSKERMASSSIVPPEDQIQSALKLLNSAKKPVIIAGRGARVAMPRVIEFAERFNIPIVTTFKAKGQIPDSHPLACGVLGRSGVPVSIWAMDNADLLLVLGASFSQHTGITDSKPTIQVDFDINALAKFHRIKSQILGEIGQTIDILSKTASISNTDLRPTIRDQWTSWRKEKKTRAKKDNQNGLPSAFIFETLNNYIPANAVITLDVGNNTYSFGRYFECKEQTILMSGYLGSIGFGYPAAMGAWAASSGRPIVAITGDGGFGQYMAEVTTAVKYDMPIKHILLNNSELGKISLEQKNGGFPVWQTELHNPNFSEFALNCGALGIRVSTRAELEPALINLFQHRGPGMVEIIADSTLT